LADGTTIAAAAGRSCFVDEVEVRGQKSKIRLRTLDDPTAAEVD
jgi:hypothetical protein